MRAALLKNIQSQIERPGMGPEELRTHLVRMNPSDLGAGDAGNAVLDRFKLKILTEGSGTQIVATAFAQWTTREALRRAEPLTLLVRFAPRQRQRPMNELLSAAGENPELDPVGSLVDADMGAYYHWINQQRLQGYDQSAFLVWFEGHNQALVIAPTLPRGTQSSSVLDLKRLVTLALSQAVTLSEGSFRARSHARIHRHGRPNIAEPKPFTGVAVFDNPDMVNTAPAVDDLLGSAADAEMLALYIWLAALRYDDICHLAFLNISSLRFAPWGPRIGPP